MKIDFVLIFDLAKVNGALYVGDRLPMQPWEWPKNTWLSRRLNTLRRSKEKESINYEHQG